MSKTLVQIETLEDRVKVVTHRNVRLHVKTEHGEEIIVCPDDFDEVVDVLATLSIGFESFHFSDLSLESQFETLGFTTRSTRGSPSPTALLRQVKDQLIQAWRTRCSQQWDEEENRRKRKRKST